MGDLWPVIVTAITAIITSLLGCGSFWVLVNKKCIRKDASAKLLIGIAHDIIIDRGTKYLERGDWITVDEYENLHDYLYLPYSEAGGNGSAEFVMEKIKCRLRIVQVPPTDPSHISHMVYPNPERNTYND